MAVAVGTSGLPPLPREFDPLVRYLLLRDHRAPTEDPEPVSISTTAFGTTGGAVVATAVDVISWRYTQPRPTRGLVADGFLVALALLDTDFTQDEYPPRCVFRLGAEAREFTFSLPETQIRSYAVAAFRATHQGEQRTAFESLAAWRGVTA